MSTSGGVALIVLGVATVVGSLWVLFAVRPRPMQSVDSWFQARTSTVDQADHNLDDNEQRDRDS